MASREDWMGRTGQEWARRGDALERLLGPVADAGLDRLGIEPGARVLDLGCGAGASTAHLADRVGPDGMVTGLDISPDLIEQARERLAGHGNVELVEADAQTHAFAQHGFDALYSRFGMMFFDDPDAAFANLHGSLKPGAPAVFLCWQAPVRNQWASVPMTFSVPGAPASAPSGPGPFSWADPAVFHAILDKAGFRDVAQTGFDYMAEIAEGDAPDPVDRATAFMMRIGPLAARLRGADEATKAEAAAFLKHRLSRHVQDHAVRLMASAWIIEARA